jgi:hypothetical protein
LAHVQAEVNGRSNGSGPGKAAAPASALHGLSGIRPELLASSDGQPRGRKKKLNESELWEVNQLKKSGVLTVEEQPDFDDEHGFVRLAVLSPCHARSAICCGAMRARGRRRRVPTYCFAARA